jgi:DNA primase
VGIVDDDIVQVRQASDIVAVISEHVALKRVGQRWQGLCPFHAEKSPSFSVNQHEGLYYCFGCQAKGDVITFVREVEHLDFVGAVEKLAGRAGVALHYTDEGEGEGRKRKARLLDAVEQAVAWYHDRLLSAPDASRARGYLRSRGLDGDDVRRYRLGWAPDSWDALAKALRLPEDVFVDSGLGFRNSRGKPTDALRGRVLFPILDPQGRALGFGGRILPGTDGPKYKNSAESAIYAKSKVLYGLSWAKGDIVTADEVVVCEGYTDVIGFAKAGLPRAVATCGTALTEEHVRLLRSFARRVVLAFDADAAGQGAADRVYAWEKAFDVDVAVAALPAGVDPADLGRSDPEALVRSVAEAVPFLRFRVDRVLDAADLSTAEGRARAAETALSVVAEHPSELVRDQYVMDVADRCRLDPDRLRARLASGDVRPVPPPATRPSDRRSGRDGRDGRDGGRDRDGDRGRGGDRGRMVAEAPSSPRPRVRRDTPETELLRLLVTRPDEMVEWDPWLHEVLFADDQALAAFRAVRTGGGSVREAAERAEPGAADLLLRLAVDETGADPADVVLLLVREASRRAWRDLDARLRRQPELAPELVATSTWLGQRLNELDDPRTGMDSAGQLLAWLTSQSEENG